MLGPVKSRDLDRPVLASLESLVPAKHFYRQLEQVLDLSFVRDWVKDCYAESGRPSVDPVIFFKLQIVMLVEGIRSERKLIELASLNLAHRWYVGYCLDEPLPDHSTLTRIRQRLGLPIFRRFFEHIVDLCDQAGLVWGNELFFDATKVQANAALDSLQTRFAVDEHLRELFAAGGDETESDSQPTAYDQPPMPLHPDAPVDLEQQNADRHDWIAEEGQPQRDLQRHAYRRVADFCMSITDPDATPMRGGTGGPTRLGYHVHDVIDGGRARIILSVLVTPGEVMENQVMLDLLWHTCFRQQRWPDQVTADTTYGTIENIVPIEDAGITMYTPLPDWDSRTPYFGASRFAYDPETDTYRCPAGQTLRRDHAKYTEGKIVYQAAPGICEACALKPQCTTSKEGRRIHRSMDETYRDRIRAYHQTEPYQKAIRKRKVWVEPIFAEAKLWHGMRRFPPSTAVAGVDRGTDDCLGAEPEAAPHVAGTEHQTGFRDGIPTPAPTGESVRDGSHSHMAPGSETMAPELSLGSATDIRSVTSLPVTLSTLSPVTCGPSSRPPSGVIRTTLSS